LFIVPRLVVEQQIHNNKSKQVEFESATTAAMDTAATGDGGAAEHKLLVSMSTERERERRAIEASDGTASAVTDRGSPRETVMCSEP